MTVVYDVESVEYNALTGAFGFPLGTLLSCKEKKSEKINKT